MLLPVLLQCHPAGGHSGWPLNGLVPASYVGRITAIGDPGFLVAAVGTHTLGLLVVAGAIAVIVYEKAGLALLRRAWVNLDLVWSLALAGAGIATLVI